MPANRFASDLVTIARTGGHTYVIVYPDGQADLAIDQLARWAVQDDLPLTLTEAHKIADAIETFHCRGA